MDCSCSQTQHEELINGIRYWVFYCSHYQAQVSRVIPGQKLMNRVQGGTHDNRTGETLPGR